MNTHEQNHDMLSDQYQPVIEKWLQNAEKHYHIGNSSYASYWAEKTTELDGDNIKAWNLLGRIELDGNRLAAAEYYFKQALRIEPQDATTLINLGYTYLAQQHYNGARDCFSLVLSLKPESSCEPESEKARISMAYTALLEDDIAQAFMQYRQLFRQGVNNQHVRDALIDCAEQLVADRYLPDLEQDLITLFQFPKIKHDRLAPLTISLLKHKYQLHDENHAIDINDLVCDDLLLAALDQCVLNDLAIESLIKGLRESLFIECMENKSIKDDYLPLILAIAHQAANTDYVFSYNSVEMDYLQTLRSDINVAFKSRDHQLEDVVGALLLLSLYSNLYDQPFAFQIAAYDLEDWPLSAQPVLERNFYQRQEHALFRYNLAQLNQQRHQQLHQSHQPHQQDQQHQHQQKHHAANDDQHNGSYLCRQWLHVEKENADSYLAALDIKRCPLKKDKLPLRVLVLAADGGRNAIRLASNFPELSIVALEPNLHNTAYAMLRISQLPVNNIEIHQLAVTDDLQARLNEIAPAEKFDVIECSDWLDFCPDTEQFVKILESNLQDNGLLKFSVTANSKTGNENLIRNLISEKHIVNCDDNVHALRDAIIAETAEGDWQDIVQAGWFYHQRSVINHFFVTQRAYDLQDIDALCQNHALEFLGFTQMKPGTAQSFKTQYPVERDPFDLLSWHPVVQKEADAFSNGFHFFCRKLKPASLQGGEILKIKHAPAI